MGRNKKQRNPELYTREAQAAYKKAWYYANPEKMKEYRKRYQPALTARRRRLRSELKADLVAAFGGACVICGYNRSQAALDFDHIDPSTKVDGVTVFIRKLDRDGAFAEAEKCRLICANCHREHTWDGEEGWWTK